MDTNGETEADRSAGAAPPCDHIVNGAGGLTECGRTFPCEYHDRRSAGAAPLDVLVLREALVTALSVLLHEDADPDCGGDPPYSQTEEQAQALVGRAFATPIVENALAAEGTDR